MTTAAPTERSYLCTNHPDREGIGICIVCRRVMCVECSTKIDGVNHCKECLAKRAGRSTERGPGRLSAWAQRGAAVVVVAVSVLIVAVSLAAWGAAGGRRGGRYFANRQRLETIAEGLRAFKANVGRFPDDREGLAALVKADPAGDGAIQNWAGPYVDATWLRKGKLLDGFGENVLYRGPRDDRGDVVIGSKGADRRLDSDLLGAKKVGGFAWAAAQGDDAVLVVD